MKSSLAQLESSALDFCLLVVTTPFELVPSKILISANPIVHDGKATFHRRFLVKIPNYQHALLSSKPYNFCPLQ